MAIQSACRQGLPGLGARRKATSSLTIAADSSATDADGAGLTTGTSAPAAAGAAAGHVAAAMRRRGTTPPYADCNAVSPATARRLAETMSKAGAPFIDVGIIGPAPGRGAAPRFYASGPDTTPIRALDGKGIVVRDIGAEVGRAFDQLLFFQDRDRGERGRAARRVSEKGLRAQRLAVRDWPGVHDLCPAEACRDRHAGIGA